MARARQNEAVVVAAVKPEGGRRPWGRATHGTRDALTMLRDHASPIVAVSVK